MKRDKTIYPIRVGEIVDMLEAIYSEVSSFIPKTLRESKARFFIENAEVIGIDPSSFHDKSDLVSDAGIEVQHE